MVRHFTLPKTQRSITRVAASTVPSPKNPSVLEQNWQMDVNALAFSKMSLYRIPNENNAACQALVAVPALTKDEFVSGWTVKRRLQAEQTAQSRLIQVDIFHLPSQARVHRSVGADAFPIGDKTGALERSISQTRSVETPFYSQQAQS